MEITQRLKLLLHNSQGWKHTKVEAHKKIMDGVLFINQKITKPFTCIVLIFFCSMTDRQTDQVNQILDAH